MEFNCSTVSIIPYFIYFISLPFYFLLTKNDQVYRDINDDNIFWDQNELMTYRIVQVNNGYECTCLTERITSHRSVESIVYYQRYISLFVVLCI